MVGSEVILRQKISTENMVADVGYDKVEYECLITDNKSTIFLAIARYRGTVSSRKFSAVGAGSALTRGWGNNRANGAPIYEIFHIRVSIQNVKQITFLPGHHVHVRGPGRSFGAFAW